MAPFKTDLSRHGRPCHTLEIAALLKWGVVAIVYGLQSLFVAWKVKFHPQLLLQLCVAHSFLLDLSAIQLLSGS